MSYICEPKVKIIQDSITDKGVRLTTFELTFWRPLLPQMNTHRVFSRNYSSNRAKPVNKLTQEVKDNPWGPKHWILNDKGMVGTEEITNNLERDSLITGWKQSAFGAAQIAEVYAYRGIHKQIVNRILEPYSSVTGLITSTEWDNFFKQRCAKDAQPEMQDLAWEMRRAMDKSIPVELKEFQWHLPYITAEEREEHFIEDLVKASAARCARVSYKTFDGTTDIEKDMELCDKLIKDGHLSPLEHVAEYRNIDKNYGNFSAPWFQLRKFIENNLHIRP